MMLIRQNGIAREKDSGCSKIWGVSNYKVWDSQCCLCRFFWTEGELLFSYFSTSKICLTGSWEQ